MKKLLVVLSAALCAACNSVMGAKHWQVGVELCKEHGGVAYVERDPIDNKISARCLDNVFAYTYVGR